MKYYLVKYENGLFTYKGHKNPVERIMTFRPSNDHLFNKYCISGTVEYFTAKRGLVLFESENLDEIVERATIEAL